MGKTCYIISSQSRCSFVCGLRCVRPEEPSPGVTSTSLAGAPNKRPELHPALQLQGASSVRTDFRAQVMSDQPHFVVEPAWHCRPGEARFIPQWSPLIGERRELVRGKGLIFRPGFNRGKSYPQGETAQVSRDTINARSKKGGGLTSNSLLDLAHDALWDRYSLIFERITRDTAH